MNSTAAPKEIEPHDALIARADERLAHVREQIARADEQLARVTEQLAKMERDSARPPTAGPDPQSPLRRPGLRAQVAFPMAACIVVAALVLQSSFGGAAKLVVARSSPQLASTPSSLPENPPFPARPAPSKVQVAAAEATRPQATPVAQTAPQDAAPTATEASPDQTQLLQTIARGLAKVERDIEDLKASQEEMKRVLAKVSEQNMPKTSLPPTQPTPTLRKPERTLPHVRARPRTPSEEWYYSDWW
jgi:uncharacterized coiled-coil protein SlyX